jgi:hypothetical protein
MGAVNDDLLLLIMFMFCRFVVSCLAVVPCRVVCGCDSCSGILVEVL